MQSGSQDLVCLWISSHGRPLGVCWPMLIRRPRGYVIFVVAFTLHSVFSWLILCVLVVSLCKSLGGDFSFQFKKLFQEPLDQFYLYFIWTCCTFVCEYRNAVMNSRISKFWKKGWKNCVSSWHPVISKTM